MNHYCYQSREFWNNVKCTRGDSDIYRIRTTDEFDHNKFNEVYDDRLLKLNSQLK